LGKTKTIMDLATKKIIFMEQFLALKNENIIDELSSVLAKAWNKNNNGELTEYEKKFLDERVSYHKKNPTDTMSLEEMKEKLERNL
jgi:hypothetical protein